jgi:hypothetical protein
MLSRVSLAQQFATPSHRPLPAAGRSTLSLPLAAAFLMLPLLAFFAPSARGSSAPAFALAANRPHPAVARIIAHERGAISLGSGTLVHVEGDCGLVVTNWHVVRDATGEISVAFPSGFRSPATVAKVDADWDLAALIVWRPNVEPVRIADGAPQIGQLLTIAGYGSGDYLAQRGQCTQYVAPGLNLPYEMVEVSAQARQGDSGGPIFNDRGELAGVLFGAARGSTSGSHSGRVRSFLTAVAPRLGQGDATHIAAAPTAPRSTDGWRSRDLAQATEVERFTSTPRANPTGSNPFPLFEPAPAKVATFDGPVAALSPARTTPALDVAQPVSVAPPSITADRAAEPLIEATQLPTDPTAGNTISLAPVEPDSAAAEPTTAESFAIANDLWAALASTSLFDQAKTFLALFGVIAFAYHALRIAAPRAPEAD